MGEHYPSSAPHRGAGGPTGSAEAHPIVRTWSFGPVSVGVVTTDDAAAGWLSEFLEPWFTPTDAAPAWRVAVSTDADAYPALLRRVPSNLELRACFTFDQRLVALPGWAEGDTVSVLDVERSCVIRIRPSAVEMIADPRTRRWRITLSWVLEELVATALRRTHLDLHAAAVDVAGRAFVIVGPTGAGKTSLALHLLQSGRCGVIANDRVFACDAGGAVSMRGVPTAIRLEPSMAATFAELRRRPAPVERAYLYTREELAGIAADPTGPVAETLTASPTQLAHQFHTSVVGIAPAAVLVFPQIRDTVDGWAVERLACAEVHSGLVANLYGTAYAPRPHTVFESCDSDVGSPPPSVIRTLAETVPAYRVVLGRHAYTDPAGAIRLLDRLSP